MSDIKMIVRMCTIENVPVEYSRAHRLLLKECSKMVADFFTEEITFPKDDAQCSNSTNSGLKSATSPFVGEQSPLYYYF